MKRINRRTVKNDQKKRDSVHSLIDPLYANEATRFTSNLANTKNSHNSTTHAASTYINSSNNSSANSPNVGSSNNSKTRVYNSLRKLDTSSKNKNTNSFKASSYKSSQQQFANKNGSNNNNNNSNNSNTITANFINANSHINSGKTNNIVNYISSTNMASIAAAATTTTTAPPPTTNNKFMDSTDTLSRNTQRETLHSRFDFVRVLGKGTYGKVKLANDKRTGKQVRTLNKNTDMGKRTVLP